MPAGVVLFLRGVHVHGVDRASSAAGLVAGLGAVLRFPPIQLGGDFGVVRLETFLSGIV
jgi:hypothetical protein